MPAFVGRVPGALSVAVRLCLLQSNAQPAKVGEIFNHEFVNVALLLWPEGTQTSGMTIGENI